MQLEKAKKPTRRAFAERMKEYGSIDGDFVVFEADIGYSTYSHLFGDAFPKRYFNMGIAEQNEAASAAGMASDGRTVVVCTYGVFLSMRALEMIRSFICYPNLNVKFLASHGGLTAAIDGVTHQATEDIAILTTLPNMKVFCPADSHAARSVFDLAMGTPGPVYTRLMRDPLFEVYSGSETFKCGGSHCLREGKNITIVSYGDILFQALEAAESLAARGVEAEVLDMYSLKPFDADGVLASARKTGAVLVAENHQRRNGLGYEIAAWLLKNCPVPFDNLGLDDTFAESGDYPRVIQKYGISCSTIVSRALQLLERKETL
ncbi:MAG: 1-deoxy-D-xylulose-5-phosphate synthase [Spirochaetales bacterium]|nr:1-deoxy-D-xylulose-5-phosphate synthase [Spirochaetales bacterium]